MRFFHYLFWDDVNELTGAPFPPPLARLDVTGTEDVLNPRAPHVEKVVRFFPDTDDVGTAKTVIAGELEYTLTLQAA